MQVAVDDAGAWTTPDGRARLTHASATHPGAVRSVNEDAVLTAPPIFAVADGMGGHARGDRASRLVVEALAPLAAQAVTADDIERAIRAAQTGVEQLAAEFTSAPGSTLVAAAHVLEDGRGYWLLANLGDSRAYVFAEGTLNQVSTDHSVIQELIDAGRLTPDEALVHPERHVITRAITGLARYQADFALVPAAPGSRLLLCSDGLTTELSDVAISHILGDPAPPEVAVLRLVDAAVAAGGHDNVSVVLVDVLDGPDGPDGPGGTGGGPQAAGFLHRLDPDVEDTRPSGGPR